LGVLVSCTARKIPVPGYAHADYISLKLVGELPPTVKVPVKTGHQTFHRQGVPGFRRNGH
jgi:hypothetical protein